MDYFDINIHMKDFLNNKIVVNCITEEDAIEFLSFLHSKYNLKWIGGDRLNHTNYDNYEQDTCYNYYMDVWV